jgi:hypothetical protein
MMQQLVAFARGLKLKHVHQPLSYQARLLDSLRTCIWTLAPGHDRHVPEFEGHNHWALYIWMLSLLEPPGSAHLVLVHSVKVQLAGGGGVYPEPGM